MQKLKRSKSKLFAALSTLIVIAAVFLLVGCGSDNNTPQTQVPTQSLDGLPPDPGEAGKATVAGIDSDGDGVRDDIQRYIAMTHPDSEKKRAALTQDVKVLQQSLLDADNKELSMKHAEEGHRSSACAEHLLGLRESIKILDDLRAQLLNTDERIRAYFRYDKQLGDEVFSLIPNELSACDFDPAALAN
ncbi:MAG: hypothetical protein COX30_02220 [Candidatus Moranbacteria bacterium CG23_combo_of_CG06-09_8_20_14_all_39_10]|nr:MAG: hypothetical protein COX30_02220 [Candidatus Moranbacteria bacterium CG23_combo_of_CG06-09_8_20_14_all_39_10]